MSSCHSHLPTSSTLLSLGFFFLIFSSRSALFLQEPISAWTPPSWFRFLGCVYRFFILRMWLPRLTVPLGSSVEPLSYLIFKCFLFLVSLFQPHIISVPPPITIIIISSINWPLSAQSLSYVQLFVAPWTAAWSGLPFPSPKDLPDPGIQPVSPAVEADSLALVLPGKPWPCTI